MIEATIIMVVPREKWKEVLQTFKAMAIDIRTERGCVSCGCYVDVEMRNTILFREEWKTSEDLAAHLGANHFNVLVGAMKLLKQEPDIQFNTIAETVGAEAIGRRFRKLSG